MSVDRSVIAPGATIGIIGGGQLGRMTAMAAARLGYRSHIFCPEEDCPASQVAPTTTAAYEDQAALTKFAGQVDVVTFEFENIPAESVRILSQTAMVRPNWHVLETAQDRVLEKSFFNSIDVATANWRPVRDLPDLVRAVGDLGRPSILKTARFGYDGKGQVRIDTATALEEAWAEMRGAPAIFESFVDFEREVSVIVARGPDGKALCFDVVENRHRHHILHQTIAPATISAAQASQAEAIAVQAAEKLDLIGLLAVELFVTRDGRLLVNEMAPRPHNSGHWTIDACSTSQFEQFVRAVCGLPLGNTTRHSDAVMTNLIGDDVNQWSDALRQPQTCLHLYGKTEARPGRKMGHVTRLFPFGRNGQSKN
ncbi:5-(carboxyamino)imidazole ribonucleotide synthase [Telmatospirillum sp.]|uniref:5-(carboxyamino)imidazole ribonucleotide synthase n=1 Tax=Telmatospirillum sp. TaxID=2079197 RepID=UPI002842BA30|nr:5-(carboxyamino)imidazole ribonucleotide synthase [Telmatospirillum sp.]MDR3439512.1 5-(carboxyamino)imidazole ribonucleotide synthase [Telmatospirillum sp.]